MTVRLEHANLAVRDPDAMIAFVRHAFPDWAIRGEGKTDQGTRWIHVGTDATYIAFQEAPLEPAEAWIPYAGKPGTNHLGFEVDDAESVRRRLLAEGYLETTYPNAHPHRQRVYFHDPEGNDWEFVAYRSDDPALRNDYDLPG
jgi:catechol 2,3-dioxygenase-like lactoylglutathione lyase family enzyme